MARSLLSLFLVLALPVLAFAQTAIEYVVTIPHPEQRWLQVDATFPARAGVPLEVRMARSSPGRYATHEFAKNVYRFEALDANDRPLAVTDVEPGVWRIAPTGRTVHVRYRLFADRADGTYAAVDATHAHLNIPATFVWAPALTDLPIRLRLTQPPGKTWTVATQLFATADPLVLTAPNFQYFMDSPIEFGPLTIREFTVERASGPPARIRLAVHHLGTDAEVDAYAKQVETVVREQQAVFGELPDFDGGPYTFLMDYLPWASGDGMEHRNSTVCSAAASLETAASRLIGTVSHEFFHVWNVERIRPKSLEPFDFTKANMSGELWLAEGFTQYYGPLTLIRSGIVAQDAGVTMQLAGAVNGALTAPGTQFRSPVAMSRLAPYVDAATAIDPTNWENTFYSYYPFGSAIALGLDLTLRERSEGKVSLDDYMRHLWKVHGAPAARVGYVAKPYTLADLERALAVVSGDAAFAKDFFARHIHGTDPLPYADLLASVGYTLTQRDTPTLGPVQLQLQSQGRLVVVNNTVSTSAVYAAGLGRGDTVISLNGTTLGDAAAWERVVSGLKVGDEVDLVFESRGQKKTARVTVQRDPRFVVTPAQNPTPAQLERRAAWLGSKATPRP